MTGIEEKLHGNLQSVRDRIGGACARARRNAEDVRLVVVTKSVDIDVVSALVKLGVRDLGENRVQQLTERVSQVNDFLKQQTPTEPGERLPPPRWHMIGTLQRNKVKAVLPAVTMIHSVDQLRLAEEINRRADAHPHMVDVLLEVNGGDEPQKSGAAVCAAAHLGEQIASLPNVRLRGLMSMAPLTNAETLTRQVFTRVSELFEEMRNEYAVGSAFDVLSMGMSGDFEIAVECGSNLVRIGSAVFEGLRCDPTRSES